MPFFAILLQLLRDSYVYIPCTAVMGKQDQVALEQMIRSSEENGGEGESLKGQKFTNEEDIRFIPDILHDGEDYFFPVFISAEEMGKYGEHFSKIGEHVLNVLALAENSEKNVVGLIINPFTDACVIHKDLFQIENYPAAKEEDIPKVARERLKYGSCGGQSKDKRTAGSKAGGFLKGLTAWLNKS